MFVNVVASRVELSYGVLAFPYLSGSARKHTIGVLCPVRETTTEA